jgi:hypothetical protein
MTEEEKVIMKEAIRAGYEAGMVDGITKMAGLLNKVTDAVVVARKEYASKKESGHDADK